MKYILVIQILLKPILKGPINNNSLRPSDAYMYMRR